MIVETVVIVPTHLAVRAVLEGRGGLPKLPAMELPTIVVGTTNPGVLDQPPLIVDLLLRGLDGGALSPSHIGPVLMDDFNRLGP